ncbi:TPR repeat protein 35 [Halteromyces radiatus]|uniref:TPR repeat protein 35 n=1 Tax=Halteromyces radiatus TaxID=101107 RepID=UPI00221FA5D9|nr:TPR repeat protein 35 [Halteromyces radiatus]KAI8097682.1 TPR repeat protein 35 [Halteromyces radiatus]
MPRFDYTQALEELKTYRMTNERQSEKVASLGARLLRDNYTTKLGDEVWPLYEQICIAALDVDDQNLANVCIDHLQKRFGESSLRFRRLLGMRHEAAGRLDEAQQVYDSILQEDETHMLASKRQIALFKTRNKDQEAVEALTKYLDTYYDDFEGWLELCELYLTKYMYEQAAFCCEEMILLQPTNHIVYLKYAEILYTLQHYSLALKHYCKVLELCTDHVRALYGLHLCASKLLKDTEVQHAGNLHALATERLLDVYQKQPHEQRKIVESYLSNIELNQK